MAKQLTQQAIDRRAKFVNAWNNTMVKIWAERIEKLDVVDTGRLLNSVRALPVDADGKFLEIGFHHLFSEYGLWQDLGVGREVPIGNPSDIGREKKRERRRWFSIKYFSSILNLKGFLALSMGDEFKGLVADALNADRLRMRTKYYQQRQTK